jgi:hypothetical protein
MWDFSGSDRGRRALRTLGVAALLLAAAGSAYAAHSSGDSANRKITIDSKGVHVHDAGSDVQIGGSGNSRVTVETGSDSNGGHKVVVVGPQISVDEDDQVVRVFSDVVVKEGQRVDGDVVTVFGSSRIEGHVTGNAVAVLGSVKLGPHAVVDGDMVAILGAIDRAEGASVGGESVDIGVVPPIPGLPALPTILLVVGLLWLLSIVGGWIVSLIMPERLLRITATASRRTVGSVLLGICSLPLMVTACVLLCITVIGIPLAVLLPVAFVVICWIGQYAGAYGLGLKLMRRRLGEGPMIAALAVGTLFVSMFFVGGALLAGPPGVTRTVALFLVAVGSLFGFSLSVIGTGAVLLSRFGSTPRDVVLGAEALAVPGVSGPSAPPVVGA